MRNLFPIITLLLAACSSAADNPNLPGNAQDDQPFAGIGEGEVINLTGTEPFWGGEIRGGQLNYTTPENIDGVQIDVIRFAGRGGLSFSGELAGETLDIAITPGACSDGMSDRSYPFAVTLQIGDDQRMGCGWSDRQGYSGGEE